MIKWTPSLFEQFNEFDDVFKALAPLSNNPTGMYPAVDIYQDDKHVIVEAQLAGIDAKDVEVSIENDVLTLEGKVEKKTEVDEQHYYRKEIRSGSFHRAVALPSSVEGDKAVAEYDQGVLKVTIPKQTQKEKRAIKITVNKKK